MGCTRCTVDSSADRARGLTPVLVPSLLFVASLLEDEVPMAESAAELPPLPFVGLEEEKKNCPVLLVLAAEETSRPARMVGDAAAELDSG